MTLYCFSLEHFTQKFYKNKPGYPWFTYWANKVNKKYINIKCVFYNFTLMIVTYV